MTTYLPLPKILEDTAPGGLMLAEDQGVNAVTESAMKNKYMPLEMAIKAQNALSYNNRMGNIGLFLRGISQMPVAERQAYLADPTNRQNYNTMLEQFRQGLNSPGTSGNILTPEFINQFGFGENTNPLRKLYQYFTGNKQNANSINQPAMQAPANMPNAPSPQGINLPNQPQQNGAVPQNVNPPQAAPSLAPQQQMPQQEEDENIPLSPELTPVQRSALNAQMRANNQNIGTVLKNRADAAIAFEKFLQLHKKEIETVFKDAFKYSQLYGRAKNWLDKFKQDQPEEYVNYIKAKNSLTPLMSNGVRYLENMGVSHNSQLDAKQQISSALDALDQSPETARKVFNGHMKALSDVAEGVLNSAEPAYPGVRRKLSGVPQFKGDYIKETSSKNNNEKVKKGRILVRTYDGKLGTIPESQWNQAKNMKTKDGKPMYKRL